MADASGVRLRVAVASDAEAIATLHADSWQRHYRGAYSDTFLDGDVLRDRRTAWADRLTQQTNEAVTLLAESEYGLLGFAHVIFDQDAQWGSLLENLHVAYDLKRRGLGSQLLYRAAKASTDRSPHGRLYLWVLEQNTDAQAFYLARGGTIVETGLAPPPGGDPRNLDGSPRRLRVAWTEPQALAARSKA